MVLSSRIIANADPKFHPVHLSIRTLPSYGMRDFPPPKSVRLEQNISAKTGSLCKFRSPSLAFLKYKL